MINEFLRETTVPRRRAAFRNARDGATVSPPGPLLAATLTVGLLFSASTGAGATVATGDAAWALLELPGHHAIMRHALAPGTGDPQAFELGDCPTQRNLSEQGRAGARHTGDVIRSRGIHVNRVFSSQWCRCLETAELLDLGQVEPMEALNSSWSRDAAYADSQTDALKNHLFALPAGETAVLVTHAANILALTGRSVSSGGILILNVSGKGMSVVGKIGPL